MRKPMRLSKLDPVEDLLSRLRLDRTARRRGVAITEGPTDNRVLSASMGLSKKNLFPVGGQHNVLRCAEALGEEPMAGVVCIADRDFNTGEDQWPNTWWLVFYDDADIEAMLVESKALERVLDEWASESKLVNFGGVDAVRRHARESVAPLTALRAANARDELGLPFDELELQELFDKKTGQLREVSLVGKLANRSRCSQAEIKAVFGTERPCCPNTNRPLARGRDLIASISALIRQLIGSLSKQQTSGKFLERSLRLAVQPGDWSEMPFHVRFGAAMQRARLDN